VLDDNKMAEIARRLAGAFARAARSRAPDDYRLAAALKTELCAAWRAETGTSMTLPTPDFRAMQADPQHPDWEQVLKAVPSDRLAEIVER
jgi:hypothetical protein